MPSGPVEEDADPFKRSWDFGPLVGSPVPFLSGGATQAPGEERALVPEVLERLQAPREMWGVPGWK